MPIKANLLSESGPVEPSSSQRPNCCPSSRRGLLTAAPRRAKFHALFDGMPIVAPLERAKQWLGVINGQDMYPQPNRCRVLPHPFR